MRSRFTTPPARRYISMISAANTQRLAYIRFAIVEFVDSRSKIQHDNVAPLRFITVSVITSQVSKFVRFAIWVLRAERGGLKLQSWDLTLQDGLWGCRSELATVEIEVKGLRIEFWGVTMEVEVVKIEIWGTGIELWRVGIEYRGFSIEFWKLRIEFWSFKSEFSGVWIEF